MLEVRPVLTWSFGCVVVWVRCCPAGGRGWTVELRPHQREAVDAVVRALEFSARSIVQERGLRTQVIMATGSGKTLVATRSAEELRAGRVLVRVPSLDLLAQTEAAWREEGRTGPMIGVSSLRGE